MYIGGNQTKTKQETKSPKLFRSFDNEIKGSESELTLLVSVNLQGSRRKSNGAVNVYKSRVLWPKWLTHVVMPPGLGSLMSAHYIM